MLRLDDDWVWDLWTVQDGDLAHLFFLRAPRAVGDPDERHWHASIGHAVSTDLRSWTVLDDALGPGPPGSWDDASTWTGSVVRDGDRWAMLYTGTSTAEDGLVQRIGLATSTDLTTWTKHPGPVMEADGRFYETLDREVWFDEAWRDPWLHRDDDDGRWHAFVTARARHGDPAGRGVIGHAVSVDLVEWEVLPPVCEPFGLGQLEVPQLVRAGDRWAMVFCSDEATQSPAASARLGGTGTYHLVAEHPYGPYDGRDVRALAAGGDPTTYAGRIHDAPDGRRWFLAWVREHVDGRFVGQVADPVPVVTGRGTLALEVPRGWPSG